MNPPILSPYLRMHWTTRPVVVIASGPSLSDEQLALVERAHGEERVHAITVNNTIQRAPWADIAYFGDYTAIKHYLPTLKPKTGAEWVTIDRSAAERWRLFHVRPTSGNGLGLQRCNVNGNSGSQAICVAAMFGARRILLLGFDMKPGADGRAHWFGQHPGKLVTRQLFDEWIHKAGAIASDAKRLGVEIINCTPGSALECFPRSTIEDALR